MLSVEALEKRYKGERRLRPFHPLPEFTETGLMLGRGTLLGKGRELEDQAAERAALLLCVCYGASIRPDVMARVERAARQWAKGEKVLAHRIGLRPASPPAQRGGWVSAVPGGDFARCGDDTARTRKRIRLRPRLDQIQS